MIKHFALVACVASKRAVPCAAGDLYCSQLFREARRFAEGHADRWLILSARYGVVEPTEVIAPYEQTLNTMPVAERRVWADAVNKHLLGLLPPGARVTLLAGKKYREFVVPFLREHGFRADMPLAHLGIGKQIQWLQTAATQRFTSSGTQQR